jgi:predicted nucleic acid-binding protein
MLIIDDLVGRRAAEVRGVAITGSAGVLGLAKEAGLLPLVQPALDELLQVGLRLSASLYRQVLADAGEG